MEKKKEKTSWRLIESVNNNPEMDSKIQSIIKSFSSGPNTSSAEQNIFDAFKIQYPQNSELWTCFSLLTVVVILLLLLVILLPFISDFKVLVGISCVLAIIILRRMRTTVNAEKLLILPKLGLQVTQETLYGQIVSAQFIPTSNIKAILINETIKMQRVISYLAIILHTPNSRGRTIIPVFEKTLPRLRTLEKVYQQVVLFLETKKKTTTAINT